MDKNPSVDKKSMGDRTDASGVEHSHNMPIILKGQ
jgi:hypothetical protein